MKKIYISGQITGLAPVDALDNFDIAAYQCVEMFLLFRKHIVNPLDLKPFLGIKCWLCYIITDVYYLRKCTHIAMQKNWINSKGAVIEYFIAKFILKLEVIWL